MPVAARAGAQNHVCPDSRCWRTAPGVARTQTERAADLIVVGNRGINTRLGRILGSVPSVVSQRSPCDVLIVHTVEGGKGA
jgi:hypothetical protein